MSSLTVRPTCSTCFAQRRTSALPHSARRSVTRGRAPSVHVCAAVQAPRGVSVPSSTPRVPPPQFGFVDNAEVINSRACMIGFFALLLVELVTGTPLLTLMGFRIGSGLGVEF